MLSRMREKSPLRFPRDLREARRRLVVLRTSTAVTPIGPIEYVDRGTGFPLLLVHGIFGGHDAALRLTTPQVLARYRAVAPSRFGYLGTPMPPHADVPMQADAHAALLDTLGVEKAIVYAASAGSTSALQLAIRHPDRVAGLVLQSANVPGPHHERPVLPAAVAGVLWRSETLMWLVRTYLSAFIVDSMMGVPSGLTLSEADLARLEVELDAIFPVRERIEGIMFDAYVGNREINNHYRFESITAPTLLVHFRDDGGPPYDGAVRLARAIPGARLLTGDHGGHLGLGEHPEIAAGIEEFLRDVSIKASPGTRSVVKTGLKGSAPGADQ